MPLTDSSGGQAVAKTRISEFGKHVKRTSQIEMQRGKWKKENRTSKNCETVSKDEACPSL